MISVLIPTRNEENDLLGCLSSVSWSDDIHVYDSGSTDCTVQIARAAGARVTTRVVGAADQFGGNEAEHKNWALANVPFKYDWVLHLDADERVTAELLQNLRAAVRDPRANVAFQVRRRDVFRGRWLKHVQATPYYIRLYKPSHLRFERLINPVSVPDGPVGKIEGFLDHYPFSKGISHWLERHNSYSSLEATQVILNRQERMEPSLTKAFFAKEFSVRRYHQKELFYKLPARPLTKFLILYFLKCGFLDGPEGFTYAALQAIYEYMIVLKSQELDGVPARGVAQ